jgi:hypothetical protein
VAKDLDHSRQGNFLKGVCYKRQFQTKAQNQTVKHMHIHLKGVMLRGVQRKTAKSEVS